MTAKNRADIFKLIYLTLFVLLILQLANFFVFKYLGFTLNYQIIFGLIGSNLIAYLVSFLILILLVYLYFKKIVNLEAILILAGLLSNVLDRIFYGGVIDYFSIFFVPKFNLADILIVAGAAIVAYKFVRC